MREVIRSQSFLGSLLWMILASACASGAPNRPGREEAAITDPRAGGVNAGNPAAPAPRDAGSSPRPDTGDDSDEGDDLMADMTGGGGMQGVAGSASPAGQAGSAAMQAGAGGSRPPLGGMGGAGAGGAGAGGAGAGGAGTGGAGAGGAGAGGAGAGGGAGNSPPDPGCFDATLLWSEDFETNDDRSGPRRPTAKMRRCLPEQRDLDPDRARHARAAFRDRCPPQAKRRAPRGYGGLQFTGDAGRAGVSPTPAPASMRPTAWSTRCGCGSTARHRVSRTASGWPMDRSGLRCDRPDEVLALGIEDASGELAAAHYGTRAVRARTRARPAAARPWVRITVYVNYYSGVMHVWQDGQSQEHVTFTGPPHDLPLALGPVRQRRQRRHRAVRGRQEPLEAEPALDRLERGAVLRSTASRSATELRARLRAVHADRCAAAPACAFRSARRQRASAGRARSGVASVVAAERGHQLLARRCRGQRNRHTLLNAPVAASR